MSPVTRNVSHVMCHMSPIFFIVYFVSKIFVQLNKYPLLYIFFFGDKVVELVGGGFVIKGAYPEYFLYQNNFFC